MGNLCTKSSDSRDSNGYDSGDSSDRYYIDDSSDSYYIDDSSDSNGDDSSDSNDSYYIGDSSDSNGDNSSDSETLYVTCKCYQCGRIFNDKKHHNGFCSKDCFWSRLFGFDTDAQQAKQERLKARKSVRLAAMRTIFADWDEWITINNEYDELLQFHFDEQL